MKNLGKKDKNYEDFWQKYVFLLNFGSNFEGDFGSAIPVIITSQWRVYGHFYDPPPNFFQKGYPSPTIFGPAHMCTGI